MKFHPLLIDSYFISCCLFLKVQLFVARYPLLYLFIITCFRLIFALSLLWFASDSSVVYCMPNNSDSWTDDYFVGSSASQSHALQSSDLPSHQPPVVNYETKPQGEGVGEYSSLHNSVVNTSGCVDNNNNNGANVSRLDNPNYFSNTYNFVRRRFFWYICESERNNYNSYKDFKTNWDPNIKIRAEIKQDFLNDLEKLKLQKHTLSWFLNFRTRPRYR